MPLRYTMFDGQAVTLTVQLAPGERLADVLAGMGPNRVPDLRLREVVFIGDAMPAEPFAGLPELAKRHRDGLLRASQRTLSAEEDQEARWQAQRFELDEAGKAALAAARRRGPEPEAPPPSAALREPPLDARDLRAGPASAAPPDSALAPYLGDRVPPDKLSWGDDPLEPDLAQRVRAWSLPTLVGEVFVARDIDHLAQAIAGFLFRRLGSLPFAVDDSGGFGGPARYLHVHTSLLAPPDAGLPMGLELYGNIVAIGDLELGTLEGGHWLLNRSRQRRPVGEPATLPSGLLYIHVEAATWANIQYPGFNVPFYE